jgi:hypothetical protein
MACYDMLDDILLVEIVCRPSFTQRELIINTIDIF